ncbi:HEAT repeat domain-containing protein [Micromonospora sp. MSM11]|nr:HEAT repeat domain-containing protein [Micromonospora sp. MSM11]MCL7455931.1 HEAT repeat domain-containing protein [Micromonospora sp. MSM11]
MQLDLNSVDWASLTHAYGSAEDVPDLIRDLRSPDGEVRSAAMYELYGNIFHQGSRYEASAYAVRFLLELVADPTTPARHEVIHLLSSLAVGYGQYHMATGFPVVEMRNAVAQVPEETWQRWSRTMKNWYDVVSTGQRQPIPLAKAERRLLETRHKLAAYDAVRAGVPVLLKCLADSDAEVAGEAIQALAWFPEEMASIRPRLIEIASDDQQPVRMAGAALVALGLVGGACTQEVTDLLDRQLGSADPHLRWSAALAWALLAGEGAPDSAVAELRSWAILRKRNTEQTVWEVHPAHLALEVLDRVAEPMAEQVRADLVAAVLAEQPTSNWHNHFNVVLDYAFPHMEPDHGHSFQELTAAQRAVVLWLTQNPHVFGPSGPDGPLRQHGLPTTYEALRAYAGGDG